MKEDFVKNETPQKTIPNSTFSILVVEDQKELSEIIKDILTGEGFRVTTVENGELACGALKQNKFDLVLSDVRMPKMSGVDLLKWCQANQPVPFVFMTGFAQNLSTQESITLGATAFIPKPFERKDLIETVKASLRGNQDQENLDPQYCGIRIDTFLAKFKLPYNIYLRISASKYMKIAHSSETLDPGMLKNLKDKATKELFLRKEDFKKYVGFTLSLARSIAANANVPKEKKQEFIHNLGDVMYRHAFLNGVDEEAFTQSKRFIELTTEILCEDENIFSILTTLSQNSGFLYAHSLSVSLYSVLISKTLGQNDPKFLFNAACSGLFHDIGKKDMDPQTIEKPAQSLTHMEQQLLMTHPTRGKEMLARMTSLPPEVLTAVLQHHEDCLGEGYPAELSSEKIDELSKIVSVANTFCTIVGFGRTTTVSGREALLKMALFKNRLDANTFHALIKVFQLESTDILKAA